VTGGGAGSVPSELPPEVTEMPKYEYRVVQSVAGAAVGHLNDRLNTMADEGWEVVTISGSETVNVLVRRPKAESAPEAESPSSPAGTV